MPFNKSKALESALKFLNQGKVAQAIGEYQQILRHDPKDQATLMTVGDLFARQNDMTQATEYFERLAQVYLQDGFNSKAIAIYKKIAKLAPAEIAPLERLADLYVQQGVLSEARPLFLQIAESHLKANRAPKAVEVLHRLLEVEPENPRVQMRLAELYNVMGQKKEAAQTYFNYAQRLFERSENEEAEKLIERALGVDAGNAAALLLKARILAAAHKNADAIAILGVHPDADAGGDVTNLLVELELNAGNVKRAAERARKQLARGSTNFELLHKVTENCIETGKSREALPFVRELRDPLIEANEHDRFVKLLSSAIEKLPGDTEPLELLADFARHTSDPFQLNTALDKLAEAYAAAGDRQRAEQALEELIDHNKGDERLLARLEQLRGGRSKTPAPAPALPVETEFVATPEVPATPEGPAEQGAGRASLVIETAPAAGSPVPTAPAGQEALDEETQKYVAQALTDVDLFSSYGLTQKATALLENVLQRAPKHTPTLERLLDLYLGAGNEQRTAELASQLEQIHRERGDSANADRFTELRQRFEKAAGVPAEPSELASSGAELKTTPEPVAAASEPAPSAEAPVAATPAAALEFEVPVASVEAEANAVESTNASAPPQPAARVAPSHSVAPTEEVDLSDEWEAMVQEVQEDAPAAPQAPPGAEEFSVPIETAESEAANPVATESADTIEVSAPEAQAAEPVPTVDIDPLAVPEVEEPAAAEAPFEFAAGAPQDQSQEVAPAETAEFELELAPDSGNGRDRTEPATTDDFLRELAAEVEGMDTPAPADEPVIAASVTHSEPGSANSQAAPNISAESLNELSEVFQEFRSELGEMGEEDEDLETHYNLGIAYREMGLLDEAIGEFQKVAKAVQAGKPFPYAMNCSTLLAMSFMDKGEPKIASLWYERALQVPGLDPEAILALRYDLAVSLDMAGESNAALNSFRQVYAMNIDYRDVADRIATLQKH